MTNNKRDAANRSSIISTLSHTLQGGLGNNKHSTFAENTRKSNTRTATVYSSTIHTPFYIHTLLGKINVAINEAIFHYKNLYQKLNLLWVTKERNRILKKKEVLSTTLKNKCITSWRNYKRYLKIQTILKNLRMAEYTSLHYDKHPSGTPTSYVLNGRVFE